MTHPHVILIGFGLAYPVASFALMLFLSGPSRIPEMWMWFMFSFFAPFAVIAITAWLKANDPRLVRLSWGAVGVFAAWLAAVGFFHHWFIAAIWASI